MGCAQVLIITPFLALVINLPSSVVNAEHTFPVNILNVEIG